MFNLFTVTTYRKPAEAGADTADKEDGEIIRYEYDGCDQLSAIVYADGTRVSYAYDKNDNLTAVTDRNGKTTTYVYDAINRVTEIHRPNGISTYNTYNARDQIVRLKNTCDECGWVVSQYDYTYDDNGYIATEKAVESLYDYAWDDKHNGKHEDGRHDDKMPHGTKHNGKHDKDSEYRFQLVETDREFTYDENGRLLSSKEQEENSGLTTYDYTYDKVGNRLSYVKRTQTTKHPNKTDVAESAFYQYNDSNQLVSAKLFDGKKSTTVTYTYDDNGSLISEIGEYGTDKVETYYDYTVENRLQAVYDADELLMAAAYDGDGNRVFQLNYNLHTDEDWKDNSGNGNGNNKDNAGSGNNGNGNGSSGNNSNNGNGNGNSGNNGNGNGNSSTRNNGNPGNSGNGNGSGNTGNNGNGNGNSGNSGNNGSGSGSSGNNGNDKENSKSEGTDDAGYGNATNAEEHNSQNQSGILFPIAEEISQTETDLIAMIKTTGKEKDYELIEYILNVNTQYTQALVELNENGAMDAAYTYGTSRLTEDRFTGESNFYLYDPAGNVAGITDQDGYLWQSYRYDAFGNATFGSPQYDNEYTFNAESYNPNIQSQYLRARYYDTVKGNFLTEDSYLGDIRNPLTLNRYSYCIGNPLFYDDPSGHAPNLAKATVPFLAVGRESPEDLEKKVFLVTIKAREIGKKVKQGCYNFGAGWNAGQLEIEYMVDPVFKYFDPNIYYPITGMIFSRPVSAEDIEFAITQLYDEADAGAISYSVGKGVSQMSCYINFASAVYGVYSIGIGENPAAPSQNMMLIGPNGEGYVVEGLAGGAIYLIPGTTIAFFEEGDKNDVKREEEAAEQARKEGNPRSNHKIVEGKNSLPAKGDPNSSADLLNPDGSIKQRRYYGPDGKAQQDIDYNHSDDGTHEFPHIHEWDWSKNPPRQKP